MESELSFHLENTSVALASPAPLNLSKLEVDLT